MGDVSNEPSMEEILSSIKRIIAEDTDAAMTYPRGKRSVGQPVSTASVPEPDEVAPVADPEILELTEALGNEDPVAAIGAVEPADDTAPVGDATETKPALASPRAVEASRSALAALSALVVKPDIVGSDTLEGLVREMLKPMLTEWLDARLPDVVERLVAQEISRITARG